MKTEPKKTSGENDIATYRRIRSAIGALAIGLPIVLLLLPLIPFFETSIQNSISHYYYTNLRELFTGVLCAVGLFLIRYQGHKNPIFWLNDSFLTNVAGIMAFGIALVPTNPEFCSQKIYTIIPICSEYVGWLHYGFAGFFFAILALISINIFTIGQHTDKSIPLSLLNENNIYKTCGYLIICFSIMIPILGSYNIPYSTLILEALALIAFGTAWIIKGRALGDKGKMGEMLYQERN